jgi:hypothetical protein
MRTVSLHLWLAALLGLLQQLRRKTAPAENWPFPPLVSWWS